MQVKSYRPFPFDKLFFKITSWDISPFQPFLNLKELKKKYKHLVLQIDGGGIKGLMDAFALHVINEKTGNLHKAVDHYYGTSTGAILSSQLAMGLSPKEVLRFYIEEGPNVFNQNFCFGGLNGSVYNPKRLYQLLKQKMGDLTFLELYQQKKKHLTIATVEATQRKTWFCHYQTTPNMKILDAVMGSVSVPIIFPPWECKEGMFYDGFVGALASLAEKACDDALNVNKWKAKDFKLLSFGTGAYHPILTRKKVKSMNKLQNLNWMLLAIMEAMITNQIEELDELKKLHRLEYARWDIKLPESLELTDNDTNNIGKLLDLVQERSLTA
jgi:patatin-like phospholipase/acyl hydrolase